MLNLFRLFLINTAFLWCFGVGGVDWCPNSCSPSYAASHPFNASVGCSGTDKACHWPGGYCGGASTPYNPQDNERVPLVLLS